RFGLGGRHGAGPFGFSGLLAHHQQLDWRSLYGILRGKTGRKRRNAAFLRGGGGPNRNFAPAPGVRVLRRPRKPRIRADSVSTRAMLHAFTASRIARKFLGHSRLTSLGSTPSASGLQWNSMTARRPSTQPQYATRSPSPA